ncbi:MAG: NAD-dependent epimerase [Myxococcota bacterium]
MATILVTGAAGFIGYHVCEALLARGDRVIGLDAMVTAFDPALAAARLARLDGRPGFAFVRADLADRRAIDALFADHDLDRVIHLGARAGVRQSIADPRAYVDSNLVGFVNVLEGCRQAGVAHLTYASSSSVYGLDTAMPFREDQPTDHPVSPYAATKKANELLAHTWSHLHRLPTTGLRFFTVYGPWGRPDMALFLFTRAILDGRPIDVFNHGDMARDFTYVDDIVDGVLRASDRPATPDPGWSGDAPHPGRSSAPYRLYNLGNTTPVPLGRVIGLLEQALGVRAILNHRPLQPGDVKATWSDTSAIAADTGFAPTTPIEVGIPRFVAWYLDQYGGNR